MSRFSRSVHIEAPAVEVWAAIADLEARPEWAPQFRRLERLGTGPFGLGSQVRVSPKGMPMAVWRVTDFEEGRSFTWASRLVPGVLVTGGHDLTTDGRSTDARFWLEASGALGDLLSPLLGRMVFSRNTRGATEGLKRYVEGRRRDPSALAPGRT